MEVVLLCLLFVLLLIVGFQAGKRGAERHLEGRRSHPQLARPRKAVYAGGSPLASRTTGSSPRRRAVATSGAAASVSERSTMSPAASASQRSSASPRRRAPERLPRTPRININEADIDELAQLPAVGPRAAERIVAFRERHGPFTSVEEVEAVEGFDAQRVSRLSRRATV
jgi:competence ComEA-like helix-hairpin-helix protein